jgi:hypothetical protein
LTLREFKTKEGKLEGPPKKKQIITLIKAFVMICEATPTMFFELLTSLFNEDVFAGPAFAVALIHSIKR